MTKLKAAAQLIRGITPEHPDDARPCHTPVARAHLTKAAAESELKRTQREYKQTRKSIKQLRAYLTTL